MKMKARNLKVGDVVAGLWGPGFKIQGICPVPNQPEHLFLIMTPSGNDGLDLESMEFTTEICRKSDTYFINKENQK